ncbi:MAG: hypothetical protein BroJett020_14410 [Bacteroidota bacterium]|nr:MAG: hypothetical protein BroJett020_14410 [Bacteroidota bacterium]
MVRTFNRLNMDNTDTEQQLNTQLQELQKKLERLEERYILEEITQEMFIKYREKFKQEMGDIQRRSQKFTARVSNLDECAEEVFNHAVQLPELYEEADYKDKVRLQKMIFPEGIRYDKKKDECRTSTIKPTFLWMVCESQSYTNEKVGIPELNLTYSHLVGATGFEPVTLCL